MTIYPAIDIRGGRTVSLEQGEIARSTDYGDPCILAKRWVDAGAKYIHIVDLDGALEGYSANLDVVAKIVRSVQVPVQLGGGVRSLAGIQTRLEEIGVRRVILGTIATSDPELVREACRQWPGRIVVGMDVREGMLAVHGWVESTKVTPEQIMPRMREAGVETIVYTDIRRDGMMKGPNVEKTREIVEQSGMRVIAAGGISSLADIRALKAIGCEGAIIGTALLSGSIELEDAINI